MDKGDNLMNHFMRFDELVMSMGATGDPMTKDEMLVVLLGSLSEEFNNIVRIIENIESITIMSAKEILQREWESQEKKDVNEVALRATRFQYSKNRNDTSQRNNSTFSGRCHYCNRKGHKERDCRRKRQHRKSDLILEKIDHAMMATETRDSANWILDSGASSHMRFDRDEFMDIEELKDPISIRLQTELQFKQWLLVQFHLL